MKSVWYNNRSIKVLTHVVVWVIVLSLPYLLNSHYIGPHLSDPDVTGFFYLNTLTNFIWVALFYINVYLLIPRLFNHKKYLLFSVIILFSFCIIMVIHGLLFSWLIKTRPFILSGSVAFNLTAFVLTIAISTAYRIVVDKIKNDKLLLEKKEENLKTELSFLRSQISPHFMFNVLNNMLALSRMKSDQLEPTIFKLSSLMRYMLYEADEENVLLKREIEYLQSYIDLQQQRVGDKVKLNVMMSVSEDNYTIAPMVLIPFIENAFKHGTAYVSHPQIDIDLHTSGHTLYFMVRNRYSKAAEEIKDTTSGIGLNNVKRRLNLLYGERQTLMIAEKDNWFAVSLQINLR